LTQIIADKEKKSSSFKDSRLESLSEEKQTKIKKFSKEYIAKVNRKIEAKNAHRPSASVTPTNATASSSTHTPRSADGQDGDVSMANGTGDMSMTVEEAMGMDPDSGSDDDADDDADGEEDDEVAGATGGDFAAPGPSAVPDSWNDIHRLPPPSADEPMDIWGHEQWAEPGWESTDPRRREDLHLVAP
jgi:histone-lysine N-methyltransferase SETD2